MFNLNRQSPFDELFDFQRSIDRMFNQFWSDLPARTAGNAGSFRVRSTQDGWQVDVPLPGIDPEHVNLEVAGKTLHIRAEVPGEDRNEPVTLYEQSVTLPQFLDLDKLQASPSSAMRAERAAQGEREAAADRNPDVTRGSQAADDCVAAAKTERPGAGRPAPGTNRRFRGCC